jgi:phosphate-selective porin OprO/OprP
MPATTPHRIAVRALATAGAGALAWAIAGAAQAQPPTATEQAQEKRIQELEAELRDLAAEVHELKAAQALSTAPPAASRTVQSSLSPPAAPGAEPTGPRNAGNAAAPDGDRQAENALPVAEPRVAMTAAHRLRLESPEGYSIALAGVVQVDTGAYASFRPANAFVGPQALSNGFNARRARIGVVGTAPGGWSFGFVYDAGNSQDSTPKGIQTAQIVYGGLRGAAFEVGYSNTYFTLDQSTSSSDLLFLERSSASNIATNFNTGDSRANAGVRVFGDRYWAGAYLTGPASGDSHTQVAERLGAFERVAVQALKGRDYSLHLGVGFDQLIQAPNSGTGTPNTLSLSDQPELRIDPTTLLNTGAMGSAAHPVTGGRVWDLETAATWRNLFWQGEHYWYQVSREGLPNAEFDGWYGQVAWTLTGETRAYNPQNGAYFRINPAHPFSLSKRQWGAWEVAARVDRVDLNSRFTPGVALSANPAAVDGGVQKAVTIGLNWYPNDLVRFLLDYNHVDFDKANGTAVTGAPLGAPVGASFDAVVLRAQVAY